MSLIDNILSRSEFKDRPPVLVDVGASGWLPEQWKTVAPYSVCLAFDPDAREMDHATRSHPYRKLVVVPKIVTASKKTKERFFLTRSPFCSSALRPRGDRLADWDFADLFDIEKTRDFPAIRLDAALKGAGLERVDWFKTDSQGMDLRIFNSLPAAVRRRVLTAEFEPGILDAYQGEDKLWKVLRDMEKLPFWCSAMEVRGPRRLPASMGRDLGISRIMALRPSAGWVEVHYMNDFKAEEMDKRDFLLGWVIATIKGQHGFALWLAGEGARRFDDSDFGKAARSSRTALDRAAWLRFPRRVWGALGRRLGIMK